MHVISARSFKDWRACLLWLLNNASYMDGIGLVRFEMLPESEFVDMRGALR
jgi:hypothetical protein